MKYYVNEVDFAANGGFQRFEEEIWEFGTDMIETPHGDFDIEAVTFVEQGPLVGVQLSVDGYLSLDEFSCSTGTEDEVYIKTMALMRQPHNVWLWIYAFDDNNQPVINFCGHDDLDGLAKYVNALKDLLNV